MSDPHPARSSEKESKRSFLQKVAEFIHPAPDSPDELIETLADAEDNQVIGPESRVMLERVIRMADMTAGDVMVAAPRMDLVNIDAPFDELLHDDRVGAVHVATPNRLHFEMASRALRAVASAWAGVPASTTLRRRASL